jgi:MFS family permease
MASHDDASTSRLVVLAACLGQFLVAYNTTAVMTVLPALGVAFGMSAEALQWVMNAYMLTCAVLITAAGRLADSFGTMRVFVVSLGLFAAGTATILGAGDAAMMLVGRSLQGAGAAGLTSTSLALINVATPEGQRARAVGLWAGAVAFGFGVGPVLGGIMTIAIDWRGPFVLDILFLAAAALPCLWASRFAGAPQAGGAGQGIDYAGIALLAVALGSLLYALSGANRVGWTAPQTLALLAIALIAACAFVVRERRASAPLVCLGFFRRRDYVAGLAGMFLVGFLQMGVIYFFNLFAQAPSALHFTALEAGLALLPFTLMMFVQSLAVPRLLPPDGGSR